MQRSRSVDDLPSGGGDVWSEEATRQAMLDIIQSERVHPIPTRLNNLGEQEKVTDARSSEKMWRLQAYLHPPDTGRTIHKIGHITTPGRTLPFKPSSSGAIANVICDVNAKREKEYIALSNLPENSRGPFKKMIMQTFYKSPKPQDIDPRSRPFTREGSIHHRAIQSLHKKTPSYITINTHKSLCSPDPCLCHDGYSGQYCDILGAGTCSRCIETSNRHIADVIQKKMFPTIEVSSNCLVVPKLSKALRKGHVKQIRKGRLQELNLPISLCGPFRQAEHVTWEALHPRGSSSKMSTCGSVPSVSLSCSSRFSLPSMNF